VKIAYRLILAFLVVALFSGGLTLYLIERVQAEHVRRFFAPGMGLHLRVDRRPGERLIEELRQESRKALLLALLVAAGAGAALAFGLTRPLRALTETARYAAGERDLRAPVAGRDEIAELAAAFNELADRLAEERAREERQLAATAHELRTPLAVLKAELEALADGVLPPDPENLRALVAEVDRITRLVEELELLSVAEAGGLVLHPESVDLGALSREVFSRVLGEGAEVVGEGKAQADPDRLRQILWNLATNVAKYGGGEARITVAPGRIRVCDRGPGLSEEERSRIFEPFYRADPARKRGGSGLGLAVVRALTEAMGGRVRAFSAPEGGLCVELELPTQKYGSGST